MFLHSDHFLFLNLPTNRQSFFFLPPSFHPRSQCWCLFLSETYGRTPTTLSRGGSGWGEDLLNKSTKTIFTKPLPHTDADLVISGTSTDLFQLQTIHLAELMFTGVCSVAASEIKMSMDDLFGTISHPCGAVNKIYVIFSVYNCHDSEMDIARR